MSVSLCPVINVSVSPYKTPIIDFGFLEIINLGLLPGKVKEVVTTHTDR